MKCPKCGSLTVNAIYDGEGAYFCCKCQKVHYTENPESELKSPTPPDTHVSEQNATEANVARLRPTSGAGQRANKYGNVRTVRAGIKFASKREAGRYDELCIMEAAGEISCIAIQVRHDLFVNGVKICSYVSDFEYMMDGNRIVEDAKGMKTRTYIIKKKLMRACFGIDIQEV